MTATLSDPMVSKLAADWAKTYAPKDAEMQLLTPDQWVTESHHIGFDQGYEPLAAQLSEQTVAVTAEYIANARETARRRIVLAGYRLGAVLEALLK
jgi:hypothetical protein